eukprot:5928553-Alexandrium_andersonii.AAC.1
MERLEKMEALLRRDQAGSASDPALPGPALERASAISGEDGANKELKDAQMMVEELERSVQPPHQAFLRQLR